jgi:putative heme-binding domain-containing protein
LNWELCETLVYLQSPTAAAKGMALINAAATQEEQVEYARSLRMLKTGWTPETHRAFFRWMLKAANYHGGASFEKFLEFIRTDAVANLTADEKVALKDVLEAKPVKKTSLQALAEVFKDRTPHEWNLDELSSILDKEGVKGRNFANGRKMFGAAGCFTCHRFNNEGGMTGPDLSTAGARYSPRDFLDNVVNPSKVINDQFVPWVIKRNNGPMLTGVICNLNGDTVTINTDPADPNERTSVDRKDIKSMEMSKVSPMPEGLLNLLTKDEILDLTAYVLSGGDAGNDAFKK